MLSAHVSSGVFMSAVVGTGACLFGICYAVGLGRISLQLHHISARILPKTVCYRYLQLFVFLKHI